MEEFLDYIHYLLSYLQFGSGCRNHPIGLSIVIAIYWCLIYKFWKSWYSLKPIRDNDKLAYDERKKLLNYHYRRILLYGSALVILTFKTIVPVKFYN